MIHELGAQNSILNPFIAQLRNVEVQNDSLRFRRNMERIGEIFAYEISKTLRYQTFEIQTPLGEAQCNLISESVVLGTIMRAGLPLHQGLLNFFDDAPSLFIGAFRKVRKSNEFHIQMDYVSTPNLDGKTLIIADPMLATGQSMVLACKELLQRYKIHKIHIVSVIASVEGLAHTRACLPQADIWIGAIDEELTSKSYIVPGLGDAGDLSFGPKEDA